jgi:hypothetical protein
MGRRRDEKAAAKAAELAKIMATNCTASGEPMDEKTAAEIVDRFARITPPPDVPARMEMVFAREGGRDGGQSVKAGNIRLNMRNVITVIAEGVLTAVGALTAPWTAILGAIILWNTLYEQATVPLSERCVRYMDPMAAER